MTLFFQFLWKTFLYLSNTSIKIEKYKFFKCTSSKTCYSFFTLKSKLISMPFLFIHKVFLHTEPPMFQRTPPAAIERQLGDPLNLNCLVKGRPKPEVTWQKDGLPIRTDEFVSFYLTCKKVFFCLFVINFGYYWPLYELWYLSLNICLKVIEIFLL